MHLSHLSNSVKSIFEASGQLRFRAVEVCRVTQAPEFGSDITKKALCDVLD